MRKVLIIFVLLVCFSEVCFSQYTPRPIPVQPVTIMRLPEPQLNGRFSLEQAIKNRRSVRQFTAEPLKISQIGQLCWAAQGITDSNQGFRAAPSAGALYPIQLYVTMPDGLYLYEPNGHELVKQIDGDIRPMLAGAAFKQQVVRNAPCTFIIAGSIRKIEAKYRNRGLMFACLEAGHIAENIHLQAVTLGLGTVPVGAFDPKTVAQICKFAEELEPLYLVCAGNPVKKVFLESVLPSLAVFRPSAPVRAKRVVIIVAKDFFGETEFFDIQEPLQIGGIQSDIASTATGEIKSMRKSIVTPTLLIKDIKVDDYDAFVFISSAGISNFFDDKDVLKLVQTANEKGKIIAGINSAPGIFARANIVKNKNVTSVTGQRVALINAGAKWQRDDVVVDGNLITANGPDVARRFGTAILQVLREQTD